ncbi:MAG: MazG nucleotide pyrophosphohydrolase domain-containing protein [Candidatus Nanohaloarchaea archaeon]|nr:MazG nucleotide pyrophosphohydrolase domain-containing protein [Candidatus Nanohaloarchaea archaeon]
MNDQEKAADFVADHDLGGDAAVWVHDLQSELGEVAKEVLNATDYGDREPEFGEEMADEVGDLYFSLLGLANALGVDVSDALDSALEKYRERVEETGDAGSDSQNSSS